MDELVISKRQARDVVILDLSGDLIFGDGTQSLRHALRQLISEGQKRVCINLKEVVYLDSSGVGELISALTAMGRVEGGELILLNPTDRALHLLEISKLTSVFNIDYEVDRAVGG